MFSVTDMNSSICKSLLFSKRQYFLNEFSFQRGKSYRQEREEEEDVNCIPSRDVYARMLIVRPTDARLYPDASRAKASDAPSGPLKGNDADYH